MKVKYFEELLETNKKSPSAGGEQITLKICVYKTT